MYLLSKYYFRIEAFLASHSARIPLPHPPPHCGLMDTRSMSFPSKVKFLDETLLYYYVTKSKTSSRNSIANSGFWHIPLANESRHLAPFGRYCFNKLPFDDISMSNISIILSGLEGVLCLMDDMLVHGKTMEEHDRAYCSCRSNVIKTQPFLCFSNLFLDGE